MTIADRRTRPRDRKSAIRDAAAELFAARGFTRVTLEDIGARVGITAPAIYRHFRGKDALLDAVVIEIAERHVQAAASATGSGTDSVRRGASALVTIGLDQADSVATYLRERHWLSPDGVERHRVIERSLSLRWADVLGDRVPGITRGRASLRLAALLGAISTIGGSPRLTRPRLDHLLVDSCVAVLTAPSVASGSGAPVRGSWQPTPDRADHVLATALPLFRERGFHGTSIDDIAAAGEVAVSTIYRHYGTKHDILVDAFDRAFAEYQVHVDAAARDASSAADALDRLARSFAEVTLTNVDLIVVATKEGAALPASERPRLRRRSRAAFDAWTTVIGEVRPELGMAASRTLAAGVFPLMATAASSARSGALDADELSALTLAFARGAGGLATPISTSRTPAEELQP